jgi:ubiquinone/menaquinone biosynthesis C-methylase UbiE
MMMNRLLASLLSRPRVFQCQQRFCNNYGAVKDHFARHVSVRGKDILDIGCSTGNCASAVVPMEHNRYVGIDIVPGYIDLARRWHHGGSFMQMDARDLAFANRSFDLVLFIATLHHMDDRLVRDCFREVRRVIRRDGIVLCAEPVFTRRRVLSTLFLYADRGKHIRTESGYRGLFDGFVVSEASSFDFSIHRFCSFVLRPEALAMAA